MRFPLLFAAAPLLLVAACSTSGQTPVLPSSAGQSAYALRYNEELAAATKAVNDAHEREKTLTSGFDAHIEALKKPDWSKVELVIDDSDEAGKSADFAEAQGEAMVVKSFWDAERNDITARVNGGAQHSLKQAGCTADTAGPISYALNDAITKQLQKKLRSKNEAFVVIERYKTSLGPQNVATLEKLADDISEASYDVHMAMHVQHNRVKRLVSDKSAVKSTLDRFIEEENELQKEPGRTEADKKASQDRIAAAEKAKSEIDAVVEQAEAVSKDMEKQIEAATKEYEDALKAIKEKVAEKKKGEPAGAASPSAPPAKADAPAPKPAPKPEAPPKQDAPPPPKPDEPAPTFTP